MTEQMISNALSSKEARISLANMMVPEIQRHMELRAFGWIPPKTKQEEILEEQLRVRFLDIVNNRTDAPADVHEEISLRPWDYI